MLESIWKLFLGVLDLAALPVNILIVEFLDKEILSRFPRFTIQNSKQQHDRRDWQKKQSNKLQESAHSYLPLENSNNTFSIYESFIPRGSASSCEIEPSFGFPLHGIKLSSDFCFIKDFLAPTLKLWSGSHEFSFVGHGRSQP